MSRALCVPRGSPAACGDVQDRQCVLRADNREAVLGCQRPGRARAPRPTCPETGRRAAHSRPLGTQGAEGPLRPTGAPGDRGLGRARAGGKACPVRRGASSGLCCRHRPLLPSFCTRFTGTLFPAHVRSVPDSAPLQVELGGEDGPLDPADSEQNVPRRLPKPSAQGRVGRRHPNVSLNPTQSPSAPQP